MRILFGEGFDEDARLEAGHIIITNLLDGTRTMVTSASKLGHTLSLEATAAAEVVCALQLGEEGLLKADIAAHVKTLPVSSQHSASPCPGAQP